MEKHFRRKSETSALARFEETVCSVMLFGPADTSSSATTKEDLCERTREAAFKQHILNVFFCCFHLLCLLSFEFFSHPQATALTRLTAVVFGHTVFTSLSHIANRLEPTAAASLPELESVESHFFTCFQCMVQHMCLTVQLKDING